MRGLHVAVTGASSGIGEGLVRAFAARGAKLTLVARRRELLEKIAAELPGEKHVATADLVDPLRASEWIAGAEAALGPIDILINNAGMQIVAPTAETSDAAGEAVIRLNLDTPLRLIKAVLPQMIARKRGTLVNIASMAGIVPTPGMTYYNASKAGLAGASEGLRAELARHGINVITVYPGPVATPLERAAWDRYEQPGLQQRLMPKGNTATLARRVIRAVERRRARVIYPRFYHLAHWFPLVSRWVTDLLAPPPKPL